MSSLASPTISFAENAAVEKERLTERRRRRGINLDSLECEAATVSQVSRKACADAILMSSTPEFVGSVAVDDAREFSAILREVGTSAPVDMTSQEMLMKAHTVFQERSGRPLTTTSQPYLYQG